MASRDHAERLVSTSIGVITRSETSLKSHRIGVNTFSSGEVFVTPRPFSISTFKRHSS